MKNFRAVFIMKNFRAVFIILISQLLLSTSSSLAAEEESLLCLANNLAVSLDCSGGPEGRARVYMPEKVTLPGDKVCRAERTAYIDGGKAAYHAYGPYLGYNQKLTVNYSTEKNYSPRGLSINRLEDCTVAKRSYENLQTEPKICIEYGSSCGSGDVRGCEAGIIKYIFNEIEVVRVTDKISKTDAFIRCQEKAGLKRRAKANADLELSCIDIPNTCAETESPNCLGGYKLIAVNIDDPIYTSETSNNKDCISL